MEKAVDIQDYRSMRQRLEECLGSVDAEERCQREEISKQKLELMNQLQQLRKHYPPDPPTSLAGGGRTEAEKALSDAISGGRRIFATVLVIQRLHTINSEYGYAIGDKVLAGFHDQMLQRLSQGDKLLRWNGPAFLLLLERPGALFRVEAEISQLLASKASVEFELSKRPIMLLISATHYVFPTFNSTIQDARKKVDAFIAAQVPTAGTAGGPESSGPGQK